MGCSCRLCGQAVQPCDPTGQVVAHLQAGVVDLEYATQRLATADGDGGDELWPEAQDAAERAAGGRLDLVLIGGRQQLQSSSQRYRGTSVDRRAATNVTGTHVGLARHH